MNRPHHGQNKATRTSDDNSETHRPFGGLVLVATYTSCRIFAIQGTRNPRPAGSLTLNDSGAEHIMADNENKPATGKIGLFLGGAFALAAAIFLLVGGEFGGEKKIHGDQDLPPVASPEKK
jgi:hypothetical protein